MTATAVGDMLREWRSRRRITQMGLALEVGVSTRHLSFIETGRTNPSAQVLMALAAGLQMPLRERNTLLLAAGHAPRYGERGLDDPELAPVRAAVRSLLRAHEPFPGIAVDRAWNLVEANAATAVLVGGRDLSAAPDPVNVYRVSLHPAGMAPRVRNFRQWAEHLLDQLRRDARATGDAGLQALYEEVSAYPNVLEALAVSTPTGTRPGAAGVLLPLELETDVGHLSLFTTLTTFGTPRDVTVQELVVELFFPADDRTRALLAG